MIDKLRQLLDDSSVRHRGAQLVAEAGEAGLRSDWEDSEKVLDFGTLACAASILVPGSTIETGVFEGGTSAVLMSAAAVGRFHVGIDPFGLPAQAYEDAPGYEDWPRVRTTLRRLGEFAERRGVTYLHYPMGSQEFCQKDLLPPVGRVGLVHLDGDHAEATVRQELEYFTSRLTPPVVYVLDDHDDHFPGVDAALSAFAPTLATFERVFHKVYEWSPEYGAAGFSVWLHSVGG